MRSTKRGIEKLRRNMNYYEIFELFDRVYYYILNKQGKKTKLKINKLSSFNDSDNLGI